jgi:hypothetical protein
VKLSNCPRNIFLKVLLGKEYKALEIGRFRLSGEIHQWAYDSYSMEKLLKDGWFINIAHRDALTSYFENWREFNLDTEPDGSIYKPDLNYIEAIKDGRDN